jgi:Zn-dependent protease with chaperone function
MADALIPERLKDISPKAFQHPADRAATAALQSVPMLDQVVRKLIEMNYERALRQSFLAASVRIGPNQLPDIWALWERTLARLDMNEEYSLYVTQMPLANAYAIGSGKPMVLLNSRTIELLDEDELLTVLAHEAGHILSDHVLYRTALLILLNLTAAARLPIMAGLPLLAIQTALMEWARATELSCDRAATLVNHDPLVTCRTLMVLAAGLPSERLDLNAFLAQAAEYETWDSSWDRISRFFAEMRLTHSYPVRRVSEVRAWVESGDYGRIVDGEYPRRGDPVDARAEASGAVEFYSERFRAVFRDTGDQVAKSGERLADWLRKTDNGGATAGQDPGDEDPEPGA